jgi:hypothetical protein
MRKKLIRIAGAMTLVAAAIATGCGNEPSPPAGSAGQHPGAGSGGAGPKGGATGAGGSSAMGGTSNQGGSGGALSCNNVTPCGGNVVGTWNVTSSCLNVSGEMDVSLGMLGCKTVPAIGSLQVEGGTLVVNADGTYSDTTNTKGSVTFPLSPSCLTVSSVAITCEKATNTFKALGWKNSACTDTNGQCSCSLGADQDGGPGLVSPYTVSDARYTTAGNELTLDILKYSYCASENTLTLTPLTAGLSGNIVFQREGTMGTGGSGGTSSGGSGGLPGAGGMAGGAAGGATGGIAGAATGGMSGAGGRAGNGGSAGASAGAGGNAGSPPTGTGPCDIYEASGVTCVAAHSTIRALVGAYSGALYQVKRADGMTKDIPVKTAGGFADSAQQESFCSGTTCTITRIYDQSGHGNFLEAETPDSTVGGANGQTAANAAQEALNVGGNKVYSLYTRPRQAYWRDGSKSGMPLGAEPQGIYMVTSGTHFSEGCCYDYGNGETSRRYEAGPTMDAIYFGNSTQWGYGNGSGPWIMADMEDGMVTQGNGMKFNNNLLSQTSTYVTAMEKNNGTTEFALKAADATKTPLNTYYQGVLPPGKNPMKKQGAIVLGSGGDCCLTNNNLSEGTFYEGAIVAGYPTNATDDAIHQNIVNAGYGK